jgi:F1F0 ATPase subunit 2
MVDWGYPLLVAGAAGAVLGAIYFGGLWFTVRRLPTARRPVLCWAASFAVRAFVTALGLYWATAGQGERMAAALAGLLLVRVILVRALAPADGHAVAPRPAGG